MKSDSKALARAVLLAFCLACIAAGCGSDGGAAGGATYTVSFDSNGGSAVPAAAGLAAGSTVPLPEDPSKESYTFAGWFTDNGTFQNRADSSTVVVSDMTLYAKWLPAGVSPAVYVKAEDGFYWKDGERVAFPADALYVNALAVYGGSAYLAGGYGSVDTPSACYWVDGVRHELPDGTDVYPADIAVSEGHIYVAAEDDFYWKDDERVAFPADARYANALAVYGGSAYLAGAHGGVDVYSACYWVDGVRHDLPNGAGVVVSDIAVSEGHIYALADKSDFYWKDDERVAFPADARYVNALAVYGGSAYLAGGYGGVDASFACYWVDGVRHDLPDGAGVDATDIAVSGE